MKASFTFRKMDSTDAINQRTRELISDAVSKANRQGWWRGRCNENNLRYKILNNLLLDHTKLMHFVSTDGPLDVVQSAIDESIYRDLSPIDSPVIGGVGILHNLLGTVMRMGDLLIGSDKFEHTIGIGWTYFMMHYQWGIPMRSILRFNQGAELAALGPTSTGVHAFADLAANILGIRLFNDFVGSHPDIITGTHPEPYIRCEGWWWWKRWVVNDARPFDWRNYLNVAWDEGYNCSDYRNQHIADSVLGNIYSLEEDGRPYACPLDPAALEEAAEVFGPYRDWVINDHSGVVEWRISPAARPRSRY